MCRKNIQLGLVILLMFGFNTVAMAEQTPEIYLSIDHAVELALTNNLDFYLVKLDLEQAKSELERANLVMDQVMLDETEKAWKTQQENYGESKQKLITSVRKSYFEVLEKSAAIDSTCTALERAKKQIEIDQSKYDAGIISSLDIQRTRNSLITAENNLEKAIVDHKTKLMELNQLLGLNIHNSITLTEDVSVNFVPLKMELEEAYNLAIELDKSIIAAKEYLEKANEKVRAADNPYTPKADLEKAITETEKAKIKLKQTENELYFKIRSEYYNLKNTESDIYSRERELELEFQVLRAEEVKYESGMISNEQIVTQQEKIARLEQELIKAKWNYQLNKESFINQLTPSTLAEVK